MGYFGGVAVILIQVVFGLLLLLTVLRVVLPLSGARFRNPICQLVYRATNPALGPLGKLIPNVRNISTAGVLLAYAIACVGVVLLALASTGSLPPVGMVLWLGFGTLIHSVLWLYFWLIIITAVMSFFSPDYGNPFVELMHTLTRPILAPFRRLPPRLQGIDLSPLWALLVIRLAIYTLSYIGVVGVPL